MVGQIGWTPATQCKDQRHGRRPLFLSEALRRFDEFFNQDGRSWFIFDAQDYPLRLFDDIISAVRLQGLDESRDDAIQVLVEGIA